MQIHSYWGKVEENWAGFSPDLFFTSTHFNNKDIEIFLGPEFDEEGEEIDTPPTIKQLDQYENTYVDFLNNINKVVERIQIKTYQQYLKLYAHYYEGMEKSGKAPLEIDSKEKHFEFIKNVNYIRILKDDNIQLPIRYDLDTEHGLEIRLEKNLIVAIGGIAET